jgi:hypothetical protein
VIANTTLAQGQVIDIITFNETGLKKVRRVRVRSLRDNGDGTLAILGVNMQAENPINYNLPMHPSEIVRRPNASYWRPFVETGAGDE